MNRTLYAGVDPGLDGAMVLIGPSEFHVIRMPTFEIAVNRKKRRQLDLQSLSRAVELYADAIRLAIVEAVHAMPKQGVASSFSFGFSAGATQGILAAFNVPMQTAEPNVWKRAFGLNGDKDMSRRLASRLLPQHAAHWPLKKDDGVAEATLMALYASKVAI